MSQRLPWLKLYTEILDDPKMRRLTLRQRWIWVVIMCLSQKSPVTGKLLLTKNKPLDSTDIAKAALLSLGDFTENDQASGGFSAWTQSGHEEYMVEEAIQNFKDLEMVEIDESGIITLCNFLKRQFGKPSNAPEAIRKRVESFRKTSSNANVTPDRNANVTRCNAIEEEEDKDLDKETTPPLPPKGGLVGFEKFWSNYPKKKSKGQARKAWQVLKPNEQLVAKILQGIERAKTSEQWRKEAGQFIPYPATWLRAEGWEDNHHVEIRREVPKPPIIETRKLTPEEIEKSKMALKKSMKELYGQNEL